MEYSKPSDVSFGTLRQMAGDFATLSVRLEEDLKDYTDAFGGLADALRNTRAIILEHLGEVDAGESASLFRLQLKLASDTSKAARRIQRALNRVNGSLSGSRRRRRRPGIP